MHECPGGCGQTVSGRELACRACWARVPVPVRHAIHAERLDGVPLPWAAVDEAMEWLVCNPAPDDDPVPSGESE